MEGYSFLILTVEVYCQACEAVGGGGEGEGCVVTAEYVGNKHQSESSVGVFCGEKWGENVFGILIRYAFAVVDNLKHIGRGANDDAPICVADALDGVLYGIDHNSVDKHCVDIGGGRRLVKVSLEDNAGRKHFCQERKRLADKLIEIDSFKLGLGQLYNIGVAFDKGTEVYAA